MVARGLPPLPLPPEGRDSADRGQIRACIGSASRRLLQNPHQALQCGVQPSVDVVPGRTAMPARPRCGGRLDVPGRSAIRPEGSGGESAGSRLGRPGRRAGPALVSGRPLRPRGHLSALCQPDVLYPGAAPVHVLARVSEGRARRGRAGLARHRRNVGRRDEPARGLVAERRLLASGRPGRRGREHRVPRQRERGAARELRLEVLRGHVSALRRAAADLAPGSAYSLHRGKFHVLRRSRSDGADLCRDAPGVRIRRSTGAGAGFRIGRTRTCPASPVRTRLAA